jgi:hypothetical protein
VNHLRFIWGLLWLGSSLGLRRWWTCCQGA